MNIKKLIAELSKYDENIPVRIFDESHGHIDITEIVEFKHNQQGHYISLV